MSRDLRLLTPQQYHQGFIAPGGWRVPFGPILRVDENGNYVVNEPKPIWPKTGAPWGGVVFKIGSREALAGDAE